MGSKEKSSFYQAVKTCRQIEKPTNENEANLLALFNFIRALKTEKRMLLARCRAAESENKSLLDRVFKLETDQIS